LARSRVLPRVLGSTLGAVALLAAAALVPACSGDDDSATPPPTDVPEAGTPPARTDAAPPPPSSQDAGPTPGSDPTSRSGTRLRRRYFEPETGPGAVQTIDLFDKDLGVGCTFEKASDGELRCLPNKLGDVYYADATCSAQPFFVGGSTCSQAFGKITGRDALFKRTATPAILAPGATMYYPSSSASGGCQAITMTNAERMGAYVAEEVPVTAFAHGKLIDEPRSGGLLVRYAEGDDGSRIALEVRDKLRDTRCDLLSEPGRCMPTETAQLGLFSDASCTNGVAVRVASLPAPQLLVEVLAANGCATGHKYYHAGAKLADGAQLYQLTPGGACTTALSTPGRSYYARGPLIDSLDVFPAVKTRDEGAGPIQARRYVDADGAPLGQASTFWDATKGEECAASKYTDSSYRCVASNSAQYVHGYWSDAACKVAVGQALCMSALSDEIVQPLTPDCSTSVYQVQAWRRGGEVLGDYYFGDGSTPCGPRPGVSYVQFFELGVDLAASLPFLDLKTE
jgi:hypothetical protein